MLAKPSTFRPNVGAPNTSPTSRLSGQCRGVHDEGSSVSQPTHDRDLLIGHPDRYPELATFWERFECGCSN
jgi:hypothetical protein